MTTHAHWEAACTQGTVSRWERRQCCQAGSTFPGPSIPRLQLHLSRLVNAPKRLGSPKYTGRTAEMGGEGSAANEQNLFCALM